MQVDILSLFPEYFSGPLDVSILGRARKEGILDIRLHNIRDFSEGKHRKVDDRPYGGGPGMILMPGPVIRALRSVKSGKSRTIYLSPQGKPLTAALARELSLLPHMILLCGHYEGVDQRAIDAEVDEEISIGDYVLTSGCAAALVVLEAAARMIPGVLGHDEAASFDSFEDEGFDWPHFTRPEEFEGLKVPDVLLSGNHKEILRWRKQKALDKTARVRPDLLSH